MEAEKPPRSNSVLTSLANDETFFTQHRRAMYQALLERNVELAGMYRAAIRELDRAVESGEEASQVALVCHAMREFMGGLPGVVSPDVHARGDDVTTLTKALPRMAESYPDMALDSELRDVPVPNEIAQQLALIIQAERNIAGRIRANARLLLTGDEGVHGPQVKIWIDTYRYFQSRTHWARDGRKGALPSVEQLSGKITIVDDLMESRVMPFIDQRPSIEKLLEAINAPIDEVGSNG
jgi:hypothetical protein